MCINTLPSSLPRMILSCSINHHCHAGFDTISIINNMSRHLNLPFVVKQLDCFQSQQLSDLYISSPFFQFKTAVVSAHYIHLSTVIPVWSNFRSTSCCIFTDPSNCHISDNSLQNWSAVDESPFLV